MGTPLWPRPIRRGRSGGTATRQPRWRATVRRGTGRAAREGTGKPPPTQPSGVCDEGPEVVLDCHAWVSFYKIKTLSRVRTGMQWGTFATTHTILRVRCPGQPRPQGGVGEVLRAAVAVRAVRAPHRRWCAHRSSQGDAGGWKGSRTLCAEWRNMPRSTGLSVKKFACLWGHGLRIARIKGVQKWWVEFPTHLSME